jgi:hypothetical protein
MATRRRYKTPRGSKDGGRVSTDDIVAEAAPEPEARADVTPPPDSTLPPDPAEIDAVKRAAEAVRRADEFQKNPQALIDAYVDSMPNLSAHKRSFLKQNPLLLNEEVRPHVGRAYHEALAEGVTDDSAEMNTRIMMGVRQALEERRQNQVQHANAAVSPITDPPLVIVESHDDREVQRLLAETEGHQAIDRANDALDILTDLPAPEPPAAPRGRSLPVSAPVSRDVPTPTGRKTSELGSITLSAEERDVAHRSYAWLSKRDAEMEYARQKAKLAALRASGQYAERERN